MFESRFIFYSSKTVYFYVDWFTGYNRIMHWALTELNAMNSWSTLFSGNCQTSVAFSAIHSLHFYHLWLRNTVKYIIPPHMWDRHTVRNVDPPHWGFPFPVGLLPSSLCNCSFQSYQNPLNSGSWHSCRL